MDKRILSMNESECAMRISNILKEYLPGYRGVELAAITIALYEAAKMENRDLRFIDAISKLPKDIQEIIMRYTKVDVTWNDMKELVEEFTPEAFKKVLFGTEFFPESAKINFDNAPKSLIALAEEFLSIDSKQKGLQLYSDCGRVLVDLGQKYPGIELTGVEQNPDFNLVAKIKALAIGQNIRVKQVVPMEYCLENRGKGIYDFVISTHPFGFRMRTLSEKFSDLSNIYPYLKTGTAADWVYSLLAMDVLKNSGKVVAFLSAGCMFTNQDKDVRKYLVHNGYVEAVINLPNRMYSYTGINTVMVVLSKGNNGVRMVDASGIYTPGRRQNEFSKENIEQIVEAYNNLGDISVEVSVEELAKNDYVLLPTRFLAEAEAEIENGVRMEEIVEFDRSAMVPAAELDKISVEDNDASENYYLRLSEIHDGVIDKRLPKISTIDKKYEKYLLQNNDIILSRNGAPFKVALYNQNGKEKVLPVGNLLVLRADPNKVNPVYLKAYLESEQGIGSLSKLLTGVAMQVISMERLKKMIVPVPDIEEQNKIADKYLSIMDELEILNMKVQNARNRLVHVFDNGKDGE